MSGFLKINGRPIEDLGLELSDQGALWSAPQVLRGSAPVLGRVGSRSSAIATYSASAVQLLLQLPETVAGRRAALDRVLAALDGVLVLEWSDSPGRVQYGRLESAEIRARFQSVAWTVGHLSLPLVIRLDNPVWYEWLASSVALSANTPAPVPLGTLPSAPLVELNDTANASVTIAYRGITGEVLSSVVLASPSIPSGGALLVDCGSQRIFVWDGTSLTNANNLYLSGSFPVFDPGDANFADSVWPTIECNFAALVTWRRAFA